MSTSLNTFANAWIARYRELDAMRKKVETRIAEADNERKRNVWRRFLTRINTDLDDHVAAWKAIKPLLEA